MKHEAIPFYVYGFSDADLALLKAIGGDVEPLPLTAEDIRPRISQSDVVICVMLLQYEADLRLFRQLRTEFPSHSWGAASEDREILAQLMNRENFTLFLYPLKREEFSVTIQLLRQGALEGRIRQTLFNGLRVLHQSYRWITRSFEIQAVAYHLGNQFRMGGFCDSVQCYDYLVLAIEEALVNAVDHGNLELESSLKEHDVLGREYEIERSRRLADDRYGNRIIAIELSADRDTAKLEIRNEGAGFDYQRVMAQSSADRHMEVERVSGKGLYLMKRVFDQIRYSNAGKTVMLEKKKFRRNGDDD